jgi:hypothetical protein
MRAPDRVILSERKIQMANPHVVFRHDELFRFGLPNCKGPVSLELVKTTGIPAFKGSTDDLDVCSGEGRISQEVAN